MVNFNAKVELIFAENSVLNLKSIIINLISDLGQDTQFSKADESKSVIKMVFGIIEQEYMNDIGLEYIAKKVYLTPSYLSYLFKRETGQSLVKYITLFRLNKAKKLLQDTNMRIVDVCEKVGYSKLSYFCAIFKNNYGMTPAKFRERKESN
jgi:two-component system response regulator YesN